MWWIKRIFCSSIGCKVVMASTGLGLVGFLLAHLIGNLLIYKGAEAFNQYAQSLHELGMLLWFFRVGLIAIFVLHVYSAISLTRLNRLATPVSYKKKTYRQSTVASRTMFLSGLVVLFFVLYHLAHFTFRWTHPELNGLSLYQIVVSSFQSPLVSFFYIASLVFLMMHLKHSLLSLLQTFGIAHQNFNYCLKQATAVLTFFLGVGFVSIPVSIFLGVIR